MSDAPVWGDAPAELDQLRPDIRLINLETTITKSAICRNRRASTTT